VIATQEAERRRIAGDIHDGISQRLISLSYFLDAASHAAADGDADEVAELAQARDLLGLALALGHRRAASAGAGRSRAGRGSGSLARSTPQIEAEVDLADLRLPEHVEIALYRIAQECLQNIVKHARASSATLRFDVQDGDVRLEVTDDGIGFDTSAIAEPDHEMRGYGLQSMVERAELVGGHLHVRSRPGGDGSPCPCAPPAGHRQALLRIRPAGDREPDPGTWTE
jgi:two-component system, NarL family, sensor kinase